MGIVFKHGGNGIKKYTVIVTNGSGSGVYKKNTICTATATVPNTHRFVSWSNGATSNPYSFPVTQDITLTASLALRPGAPGTTVSFSSGCNGGSASINWNNYGIGARPVKFTLTSYNQAGSRSDWYLSGAWGPHTIGSDSGSSTLRMDYVNSSGSSRWSNVTLRWSSNGTMSWTMPVGSSSAWTSFSVTLEY